MIGFLTWGALRKKKDMDEAEDEPADIARWLIAQARISLDPLALITGFCERLVAHGVPLWRLRAGQRLANPLASA
jgi:hypothetical protein